MQWRRTQGFKIDGSHKIIRNRQLIDIMNYMSEFLLAICFGVIELTEMFYLLDLDCKVELDSFVCPNAVAINLYLHFVDPQCTAKSARLSLRFFLKP